MAKPIRKIILDRLEDELIFVAPSNGYKSKIKNIYNGYQDFGSVMEFPSVAFALGNDTSETELEQGQIRVSDLIFIGYVQADSDAGLDGKLSDKIEFFYDDIKKFVLKNSSIAENKVSTVYDIEGIIEIKLDSITPYLTGLGTNKTMVSIIFKVLYLEVDNSIGENVQSLNNMAQ